MVPMPLIEPEASEVATRVVADSSLGSGSTTVSELVKGKSMLSMPRTTGLCGSSLVARGISG